MTDRNRAGHGARTDRDGPSDQKPDVDPIGSIRARAVEHLLDIRQMHFRDFDRDREGRVMTDGGVTTARMPELPDFQRDILLTLARSEPTHGQGLVDDLGCLRDESINHGRLYPNLDQLAGKGLVEKSIRATDGRTNEYRLTPAGRAAIRSHADRVGEAVDALDFDSEEMDDLDRGDGVETDGGRDSPTGDLRVTLDRDDVQHLMKDGTTVLQKDVGPITVNIRTHQQLSAVVTVSGRRKDPDPERLDAEGE